MVRSSQDRWSRTSPDLTATLPIAEPPPELPTHAGCPADSAPAAAAIATTLLPGRRSGRLLSKRAVLAPALTTEAYAAAVPYLTGVTADASTPHHPPNHTKHHGLSGGLPPSPLPFFLVGASRSRCPHPVRSVYPFHLEMASSSNGHCPANGAKGTLLRCLKAPAFVCMTCGPNRWLAHMSQTQRQVPLRHRSSVCAKVLPGRGKKNQEKLQLDKNAASRACQKDRQYIEKLETELSNCYQEIDYLQDQLNIRNVEANIMGEHIHGLELKLTELEKFPERMRVMDNDLMRSDSQCWLLMEEVQCKEEDLQKAALQIEKLESVTLDMQCEIESLKLDLTPLEQRLFDAESFSQHTAEYKARVEKQLEEHELQLQEARRTIDHLEVENKQLKKEYLPGRAPKQSSSTGVEQLNKTLEHDGHANYERGHEILEKMGKQNEEPELLIEQLKAELREQKLKAKEDAEDLTQEMAELRYQITGMLEEEYKRRSCIEQAAIQQIQQLEVQVSKEQRKLSGALRRLQESHELADTQATEIKKLKNALGRLNSATSLGRVCRSCSCGFCPMLVELSNCSIEGSLDLRSSDASNVDETPENQALVEWRPDEASDGATVNNVGC